MRNLNRLLVAGFLFAYGGPGEARASTTTQSLAGIWEFRLDPEKVGVAEKWFDTVLPERTKLPGSTDENGNGQPNDRRALDKLSRVVEYTGAAWYQREIDIPEAWKGQRVTLFLERCHWETQAWLDDRRLGMQDSLCVPHIYDFGPEIVPGRHRLTLRVDNSIKYNVGRFAHSVTEETQTNWNGIIGAIELRVTDPVWIESMQVYPEPEARRARLRLVIGNRTGSPATGRVTCTVSSAGIQQCAPIQVDVKVPEAAADLEVILPIGSATLAWDEFTPTLHRVTAAIEAKAGGNPFSDSRAATFGMRTLVARDQRLLLNGRPIFLRGTLECCIFPRTGYPSTSYGDWAHLFTTARAYGLNHLRFHSWCPPEAAFAAADDAGFLLHVEAPQWVNDIGKDAPRDAFIREEVQRILDTYGNHPSFGMLCMGNELGGEVKLLDDLVCLAKQRDPRHLYASATAWVFGPHDDYAVPFKCRGLHGPTTDRDFREIVGEHKVPCITHELGQWTVFPNLAEIPKYRGVLKPRNFELVRDELNTRGMLEQAPQFTLATGRQMLALYKEEIESQLRTPNTSGFQLLDLHDFPGQGTALVGTLDAFWDSKGLITSEAFRRYCGPTVPLLRLPRRVYTTADTLGATAEVAHFGFADLPGTAFGWSIALEKGGAIASGAFPARTIPTGQRTALGKIELPLARVPAPARLVITITLPQTRIANDWDIWVYPPPKPVDPPADIVVSRSWDDATRATIAGGGKVLFMPERGGLTRSVKGTYLPPFWSPLWFKKNSCSMSILCDPGHPALARFPTDFYSTWQWYDLLDSSRSLVLDDIRPAPATIVQVIDNFSRNHRLANLIEARVKDGRVIVCTMDLLTRVQERPAARQLLDSILAYMGTNAFKPAAEVPMETMDRCFRRYVPAPVSKGLPAGAGHPLLRVRAAARTSAGSGKWSPAADEIVTRTAGIEYGVADAGTWKDNSGTAWVGDRPAVVVTCPRNFEGRVLLRLDDWNNAARKADILLNDRLAGELDRYNDGGRWVCVPVTRDDTAEGRFEIAAESRAGPNAMIAELIVVSK